MADYRQFLPQYRQPTAVEPTQPTAPVPGDYRSYMRQTTQPAAGTAPRPSQGPSRSLWQGARPGLDIADIMNPLRVGEFAVGGILTKRPDENYFTAAIRGIERQQESAPEFGRVLRAAGAPDNWATKGGAFLLSLAIDPINLVPASLVGKGLKLVGRPIAAAAARVSPRVAAGQKLSNVLRHQRLREALGYEQAVGVGREMIADSIKAVGGKKADALRLRQTLSEYFDMGADTMMHHMNNAISVNPSAAYDPAVIAAARNAGLQVQQAWLAQLPPNIQPFVTKWIKNIAADDTRLGQLLVQKGMLKPEVAAKWEGLHLRRIYEKFENPDKFLEFLHSTDPKAYADYAAQLARGRYPTRGVPMPTRVLTERGIKTQASRAQLGELTDAAARYMVGRKNAEELIARGTAFKTIATRFGKTADEITQAGLNFADYLPMPSTAGWGELAGKYVPKAMHNILTDVVSKKGQDFTKWQQILGWWKIGKVVLNPSSHFRNMRNNVSLAHNAMGFKGLNIGDWWKAFDEVRKGGPLLQEAKRFSTGFTDTIVNQEIRKLATVPLEEKTIWNKLWDVTGGKMERLYEFEEQWAKMSVYMAAKKQFMKRAGANPTAASARAARMAELALFNYREVPDWVRLAGRSGIYPFMTYPYKVVTQTIPQALKYPGRFSAQAKALSALSDPLTDEERRSLPEYMRTGGWFKLPANFLINGKRVLWDLNYELAYGDLGELRNPLAYIMGLINGEDNPQATALLTPFGQLAAEVLLNKSAYTGLPVSKGESKRERISNVLVHGTRALGPSWLSRLLPTTQYQPGGELARTIEAALPGGSTGKSISGQLATPARYSLSSAVLGLRTVPLETSRGAVTRAYELERYVREQQELLRSILRADWLDSKAKAQRQQDIMQNIRDAVNRHQRTGSI